MASIKDALEESVQDGFAWLKFVLYTLPLYYVAYLFMQSKNPSYLPVLIVFTGILTLGFMLKCTYNVRKGNNCVLPSFNIFDVLWLGFRGALALAPLACISFWVSVKIVEIISKFIPSGVVSYIVIIGIFAIFASFVLTGYLLFARRFKIFDAYNVVAILKYSTDVMFATLLMFFLVGLVAAVITAPIMYVLWLFIGILNPISLFVWCVIAMLSISMMGHYLAQIDYEIMPSNEDEDVTKIPRQEEKLPE